MTDREKAIVMAHTGICMLTGDKFQIFHKYVEDIMGRPLYTHEMAIKAIDDEIKEKSKADFIALCADESSSENPSRWIPTSERLPKAGEYIGDGDVAKYYLVQNEYGDMMVARYTHSEYWEQIYKLKPIGDEIVAWRELPEQYVPDINDRNINCMLDKIRSEIESCRLDEESHLCDYRYYRNEGLDMALDILDKYRTAREVNADADSN